MPRGAASAVRSCASTVLPDRSILLLDPDPAAVRAGFRFALERSGVCGPDLDRLAGIVATDFGLTKLGVGTFYQVSWIKAPRPRGGSALRIFPGPAAEKLPALLLNAIGA